jgi:hypothetical protein
LKYRISEANFKFNSPSVELIINERKRKGVGGRRRGGGEKEVMSAYIKLK